VSGAPLMAGGGTIEGRMAARDGALAELRSRLDHLAQALAKKVNGVHASGFGLKDEQGELFFLGNSARDLRVNPRLLEDPSLLQASGTRGAAGDNRVALELGRLANEKLGELNGQAFGQFLGETIAALGEALSSVKGQLSNQAIVEKMLLRQRDAVSGVSLDEEMTDLMKFQKAYSASARLITILDTMLETLMNVKR
jgi:flagellar hook-associated protein 1